MTFVRLRLNRRRILVPYVGKIPETGAGVKGVTGILSKRLIKAVLSSACFSGTICYLAEDSPTFASLPKAHEVVSRYVVYRKSL